jgi:hypothetical protein
VVERAGFEPELRSSELGRPVGIRIFAPQETGAISDGYYFSSTPARAPRFALQATRGAAKPIYFLFKLSNS